jgi:DNA-binding GntR family transcriptional regulator
MNSLLEPSGDNTQEKAYQYVKEAILGFQLIPGQRLVAADVAAALKVSRTPVREALSRLEQEGLVMRAGGWGYVVRRLTLTDVTELFKVREALELEAVTEALPNLDRFAFEQLQDALKLAAECSIPKAGRPADAGPGRFVALNRSFHNIIAAATRNELLRYMLSFINDRVQMIGAMTVEHNAQRADGILEENQAILDALKKKDAATARAAMRTHIRHGRDHAIRIFARNVAEPATRE